MDKESTFLVVVFIFSITLSVTCAAKILVISGPSTSSCLEIISVAEELLKRGHHITFFSIMYDSKNCVSKINPEMYKDSFRVVTPKMDPSLQKAQEDSLLLFSRYLFERRSLLMFLFKHTSSMIKHDCDMALKDMELINDLKKDNYDITLVPGAFMMSCFVALPILLDTPFAAVSSYIDPIDSKTPLQTNIFPDVFTQYSNEMTFMQRLINTLIHLLKPLLNRILMPSIDLSQYSEKLEGYSPTDVMKKADLFLENSDYVVDYPKAVFPNFVQVGGLTAGPAKPLPFDLKKVMDEAKDGIVLVTFGSLLKEMPTELKDKMMTAFGRLDHQVLFKQDKEEVRGNVRVLKWVPQNDILGHLNMKLFISHCGKNGFWEGVYHGVPIICIPLHGETEAIKVKVKKYGIGSSINLFDDTVDNIVDTINEVLGNASTYKNMKRISTLLRDRPETPQERAASAVEHVIKYGGAHMRPPSVEFGFLSYSCLDIWITLFTCALFIIAFDIWIIRKCCCKGNSGKRKTD